MKVNSFVKNGALLLMSILTMPPLAVATAQAQDVTFGDIPVSNSCPPGVAILLQGITLLNTAKTDARNEIAPMGSKVLNGTYNRAVWSGNIYAPATGLLLNPGHICAFSNCSPASIKLTCFAPLNVDGTISFEAVESETTEWLPAAP